MKPPAKKEAAFGYEPKAADATNHEPNNTMKNDHIQVLRVQKLKGGGIIGIAARHNLREIQAELGADSHIDPHRSAQNIILQGAGAASGIAAEAIKMMESADVLPLRKGAVLFYYVDTDRHVLYAARQLRNAVITYREYLLNVGRPQTTTTKSRGGSYDSSGLIVAHSDLMRCIVANSHSKPSTIRTE